MVSADIVNLLETVTTTPRRLHIHGAMCNGKDDAAQTRDVLSQIDGEKYLLDNDSKEPI